MGARTGLVDGERPGVRTFTPRWRTSRLTAERMARLLPPRDVGFGPLRLAERAGRVAPLVVEIGSGHGAAALAYAVQHPEHEVIAVEVHVPGVARMLAAAQALGADAVPNLWVHRGDALPWLTASVPPESVAAMHLFFPDPWPKAKHAKRRFVQQHTLDLIAARLEPGGVLRIATDIEVYAEHVREHLARHGRWEVREGERPLWRPTDGFEKKGLAVGRTAYEFTAVRGRGEGSSR